MNNMDLILKQFNNFLNLLTLITNQWETENHIDHNTKIELIHNAQTIKNMIDELNSKNIKNSDEPQFLYD